MAEVSGEQRKELEEKLKGMSKEEIQDMIKQQCIFCKIIGGEIPSYKIYEDERVLAFLDIQPVNKGHVLVVPKEHHSLITQMPDDLTAHLFVVAKKIAPIVFEMMNATGILIVQRNGDSAGQLVPHVHVHIIPTIEGDKADDFKPRSEGNKEELAKISQAISEGIKKVYGSKLVAAPVPVNSAVTSESREASVSSDDNVSQASESEQETKETSGFLSEEFKKKLKSSRFLP